MNDPANNPSFRSNNVHVHSLPPKSTSQYCSPLTTTSNHPISYKSLLMALLSIFQIGLSLPPPPPPPPPLWLRSQKALTGTPAAASLNALYRQPLPARTPTHAQVNCYLQCTTDHHCSAEDLSRATPDPCHSTLLTQHAKPAHLSDPHPPSFSKVTVCLQCTYIAPLTLSLQATHSLCLNALFPLCPTRPVFGVANAYSLCKSQLRYHLQVHSLHPMGK